MALKNISLVSSSWVLFNCEGESKVLDLDKYSILRRLRIHARDLRILDPLLSYPSIILGRERAIIVNLEHIKAIITAEEVWLRDPFDENVIPVVEELQRRLVASGALLEGFGEEDEQAADFPFEFRALEVMLEAICSYLDARTTELETDAYPALDELTSKISSRNLDRVRKLKSAMTRLTNRVQKVRDEIEQLLDDDEDMGDLYLSRKLSRNNSPVSISWALNWGPTSPAFRSKVSRTSRASGISNHEESDVEELEMLLEAYFMQIDSTMNKLTTLREYIDDTEDYINIQLDNHRNQLIQLELFLSSGTLCLSVYSLVAAVFGMNIPYTWRDNHEYLFKWVVILAGMASGSVFIWIMTYAGHKGGLAIARDPNAHYKGRITCFVVVSCIVAALGGAIFGYDIGVSGGVTSMDPFLKKFFPDVYIKMKEDTKISNYCKFDSELLTSFTSSLYFSGLFAALLASKVTKAFGRKLSILVGGITVVAGSALGGAALNIYMLILGRVLLGIGVGFANQVIPIYLVEIAPSKYRGAFNNGFHLSLSFGILLATLVNFGTEKINGGWGWRVSIAATAFPAVIITLGSFFLPETPNSLIQRKNNHQQARLTLQRIRGTTDVQEELNDLIEASSSSQNITLKMFLLQRNYRPQLVMATAIPFFQQMTGINVVGFYAPVFFRTIGFGESASLFSSIVVGIVQIFADGFAVLTVDKFGRRRLFLWGGILMLVPFIVVGSILSAKLGDHGNLSKGYSYIILILLCIYSAGFSFSWGSLGWLIPSEIFQLEIRSAAQGITVALSFIFTFLIAQTLLTMLCHFKAGIFFFFAGWIVLMTAFVHFLLPETKNVPLEKIDLLWKQHPIWRRIIGEDGKENEDSATS